MAPPAGGGASLPSVMDVVVREGSRHVVPPISVQAVGRVVELWDAVGFGGVGRIGISEGEGGEGEGGNKLHSFRMLAAR